MEADSVDDSNEIDTNLSFNDANKFEKEKESEDNSASFLKDLPSTAVTILPFCIYVFCLELVSMIIYLFRRMRPLRGNEEGHLKHEKDLNHVHYLKKYPFLDLKWYV